MRIKKVLLILGIIIFWVLLFLEIIHQNNFYGGLLFMFGGVFSFLFIKLMGLKGIKEEVDKYYSSTLKIFPSSIKKSLEIYPWMLKMVAVLSIFIFLLGLILFIESLRSI